MLVLQVKGADNELDSLKSIGLGRMPAYIASVLITSVLVTQGYCTSYFVRARSCQSYLEYLSGIVFLQENLTGTFMPDLKTLNYKFCKHKHTRKPSRSFCTNCYAELGRTFCLTLDATPSCGPTCCRVRNLQNVLPQEQHRLPRMLSEMPRVPDRRLAKLQSRA